MEGPINSEFGSKNFVFPSLEKEIGEIERVATLYGEPQASFLERFSNIARNTPLQELSEAVWEKLENADSFEISKEDWEGVAYHAQPESRDWQSLREKMQSGASLEAPIIFKKGPTLHLVSGNTRLMVARALGIKPQVLIVDMTS